MNRRDRRRARAELQLRVIAHARRFVELEFADDPAVADEGCALHELHAALVELDASGPIADPRELGGDVAGPGGAHDVDGVVVDTSRALIVDELECVLVRTSPTEHAVGLVIRGRVNRTTDRATVLAMLSADGVAAFVSELVALAGRSAALLPGFGPLLRARVAALADSGNDRSTEGSTTL